MIRQYDTDTDRATDDSVMVKFNHGLSLLPTLSKTQSTDLHWLSNIVITYYHLKVYIGFLTFRY